jgi:hypothetical protein
MERNDRRRMGPVVELLEARMLLAGGTSMNGSRHAPLAGRALAALQSSGSSGDASSTPPDRTRQGFFAAFTGSYTVGPGRIDGQALRSYMNVAGTSSTFLHGQAQVAVAIPTDSTLGPTGSATLLDKNYAQTGNFLMLDLQSDPQPIPDGRPTRLTWSVANSSSGTFAGAEGQGTLVVSYHPGGRRPSHALDWGRVGVQFRGQITLNGTTNPLRVR